MKKILLIALTCVFTAAKSPAYIYWNYTGVSHSWDFTANWGGTIPTLSTDPMMTGQGPGNGAVIEGGVAALGRTLYAGNSGTAELNVNGGSLTLSGGLRLGQSGRAIVTVSSGSVMVSGDVVVGDGSPGTAILSLTGGTLNQTGGWMYIGYNGASGTVHLDGGTIKTTRLVMGSGSALVDITGGRLVIANTDSAGVMNEINGYIQSGRLTIYGGDPNARLNTSINAWGYTEITASLRGWGVWDPSPSNIATGVDRNPTLSWTSDNTSRQSLSTLIDFKNDPCLAQFSGTAVYSTEFAVSDLSRTVLSLGTVYGISEVNLNGINLGHRWWGQHTYDIAGVLQVGTNVLQIKVVTTLSNYFCVWDNPVAQIWTKNRGPVSEGLVGPVRLLRQE